MNQILSMNQEPRRYENEENYKKSGFRNNQMQNPNLINNQTMVKREPQLQSIQRANSTSNKADLSKVVRIFCISIIIFGLILIGQSTYAIISNREKNRDNVTVSEDRMGKETKITVETNYPIKSFIYKWNDGEAFEVPGDGTIKFETTIQIPNGNNILNMTVVDYYGSEHKLHNKQYIYESTDVEKPEIQIGKSGAKLNILATDNIEMAYITYKWNNEEAERIDVEPNDKQKISTDIEVPEGRNQLTIVAADKEGNRDTITETVVGDTKPTFTVSVQDAKLIITATDDQGISRITATIDGQTTDSGETPINQKEVTASLPLTSGGHTITVTVTNVNGLTATESYTAEI